MQPQPITRNLVVISYSRADKKWLKRVQTHLRPFERDFSMQVWDDTKIPTGSNWNDEVRLALLRARVAILLVSADFMESDFIAKEELPPLLEAAENDGATIIPVILSASNFEKSRIGRFQALNDPGRRAIAELRFAQREAIFARLANIVHDIVQSAPSQPKKVAALPVPPAVINPPEDAAGLSPVGQIHRPRVFLSVVVNKNLGRPQRKLKRGIIRLIREAGFEPQEFGVSGIPAKLKMDWTFEAADEVMKSCQGIAVLAFSRFQFANGPDLVRLPTEYNHFEGALGICRRLPVLVIGEEGLPGRGILYKSDITFLSRLPGNAGPNSLENTAFLDNFQRWSERVRHCSRVFLGCARSSPAATQIQDQLASLGFSVINSIQDPAHAAETAFDSTAGGIFLFTRDDPAQRARNLIFQMGAFTRAKGKDRTLAIVEQGSGDGGIVDGSSTLTLDDVADASPIIQKLRAFVEIRL